MAWPHLEKAKHKHNQTGPDEEPPRQEKEGDNKKTPGGVISMQTSSKQGMAGTTGKDCPRQEALEKCCGWPMLQEELRSYVSKYHEKGFTK